ncbi:uncharacterized protein LOC121991530 [Zingiber officinale]|uniref:uncharacterized protein LOC121991530 n=1 Tax=Zingiber officinale TaxID=94328 RepID=UPI001C4D88D3|nr:uncharacterized protein LOC121991530 [Zingiber officinale]
MAFMCLIYLSLLFSLLLCSIEGRNIPLTEEEDLELDKELQSLNKPPVKIIKQTFSGDLFDCIEKYKQPAFDHPALKNHKLQMRPSFQTKNNVTMDENFKSLLDPGFNDTCPPGTVLIRRTRKEDLIISKELTKYFRNYGSGYRVRDDSVGQNYYAIVRSKNSSFYGFRSKISTWALPNVGPDQVSASQVWIMGDIDGPDGSLNAIQSGWHVHPQIYNDTFTHFFIYWTTNGYRTGCMNLNCKGFVQVSANYAPGYAFPKVSLYRGKPEYLDLLIAKDPKSGNWWLTLPCGGLTGSVDIGYWPKELFPNLEISSYIDFGGQVYTPNNEASPPMGSGSFPEEGFGRASHFMQAQFIGTDHQAFTPSEGSVYTENDSLDNYYKVSGDPPESGDFNVYYGGQGGLIAATG